MSYMVVSTFFLMNLFTASVFHAYKGILVDLDVYDEQQEEKALYLAWICLDFEKKGYITKQRFSRLMKRLKPNYNKFEISVLFKLMDPDGSGTIEDDEFGEMMINWYGYKSNR